MLSSVKNININYSTETVIKCWKNYFYEKHVKGIIVNCIAIAIALLMYFYFQFTVLPEVIILLCVLYLVCIFYFYYHTIVYKIKKHKKYNNEIVAVLSEDNIQLIGGASETKTTWDSYIHVFNGKDYYLLFNVLENFLLIPKEVFITEYDRYWFESKLKNSVIERM